MSDQSCKQVGARHTRDAFAGRVPGCSCNVIKPCLFSSASFPIQPPTPSDFFFFFSYTSPKKLRPTILEGALAVVVPQHSPWPEGVAEGAECQSGSSQAVLRLLVRKSLLRAVPESVRVLEACLPKLITGLKSPVLPNHASVVFRWSVLACASCRFLATTLLCQVNIAELR